MFCLRKVVLFIFMRNRKWILGVCKVFKFLKPLEEVDEVGECIQPYILVPWDDRPSVFQYNKSRIFVSWIWDILDAYTLMDLTCRPQYLLRFQLQDNIEIKKKKIKCRVQLQIGRVYDDWQWRWWRTMKKGKDIHTFM